MNEDPSRSLDELLSTLERLGAEGLAEVIRRVVSRGTIEEKEVRPHKYEGVQQPLTALRRRCSVPRSTRS